MTDVAEAMTLRAWDAYQQYLMLPSTKDTLDFHAFSIGFSLGAIAAAGKPHTHQHRGESDE